MTNLDRQIRTAQHRLWLNRWFYAVSRLTAFAAAAFSIVVIAQRLYDWPIPLLWVALGLGAGTAVGSVVWTLTKREGVAFAAAALDRAAGLRERLSSGQYCREASDPFAQAVVTDAERVSSSLSARCHIRLTVPKPLAMAMAAITVSVLLLLLPPGLLERSEATEAREQAAQLEQTKVAVKRKMDAVRKIAEANPALEDFKDELADLDSKTGGELLRPSDVRHEAIKKIDKLADAVKQKRREGNYESVNEMRKMLRGLKMPKSSNVPTQKLSKALRQGDFKTAKEEINALREQLATLKSEQDKELVAKISKQLADIGRQLEKLAKNEQLVQKLQQAGLKKEDIDRLLENLKKKDLDQLKKQLEEKGMSQQQIQKLAKQLQQRQQAGSLANKLAQSMKQGAQCGSSGQMGESLAGLSQAADQLSELEQLEQEMIQLDSTLAGLQEAKDGFGDQSGKQGGGMGRLGRGRGGIAPEEQTAVSFKIQRGKVHTGEGAIIGQFLFDGEQVKGEVSSSIAEIVAAGEHDASDRINRNRIPRQYHKAVKAYFSNVQRSIKEGKLRVPDAAPETRDSEPGGESADDPRADSDEG